MAATIPGIMGRLGLDATVVQVAGHALLGPHVRFGVLLTARERHNIRIELLAHRTHECPRRFRSTVGVDLEIETIVPLRRRAILGNDGLNFEIDTYRGSEA